MISGELETRMPHPLQSRKWDFGHSFASCQRQRNDVEERFAEEGRALTGTAKVKWWAKGSSRPIFISISVPVFQRERERDGRVRRRETHIPMCKSILHKMTLLVISWSSRLPFFSFLLLFLLLSCCVSNLRPNLTSYIYVFTLCYRFMITTFFVFIARDRAPLLNSVNVPKLFFLLRWIN